mmetsp:Transcript_5096/g.11081  ORF Transcript_5096/g.11081 Transcript_5096/m.11081 type:complete len:99 (+) Transcript_5096:61-357(+)
MSSRRIDAQVLAALLAVAVGVALVVLSLAPRGETVSGEIDGGGHIGGEEDSEKKALDPWWRRRGRLGRFCTIESFGSVERVLEISLKQGLLLPARWCC